MGNKYPKTMVDAGRQGLIFAVNTNVHPLDEDKFDNTPPMTGFSSWSAYQMNFADSEKQSGGSGNIEINHVADVKARTQFMIPLIMQEEAKRSGVSTASNSNTIFETKISYLPNEMKEDRGASAINLANKYDVGLLEKAAQNAQKAANDGGKYAESNLKQAKALRAATAAVCGKHVIEASIPGYEDITGMTVADIYASDMKRAANFTGELAKAKNPEYPFCKAVYSLLKIDGKDCLSYLSADTSASGGTKYTIYAPVLKTPNTSKVDENGLTKAYELAVYCDPTHLPYPFKVQLSTMKGKPIAGQKVGVQAGTITDRKAFSIDLTSWEWMNMVDRMDWEKNLILMFGHKKSYEAMERFEKENRES